MLELIDIDFEVEGKRILRKITMKFEEGKKYSILGMNGAGKSTIAYVIMGLEGYKPTAGKIYLDGEDITDLPVSERAKRGITLLWQEPARFRGLTVKDYLTLGGKLNIKKDEIAQILELVGLSPLLYMNRTVDESLSGGDRNYYQTVKGLVAGARALKKGGILIIAAECIDGLGSEYFKKSLQILKEIGDYDRYIDYISKPENFLVDQWEVEELVKVLKVASKIFMFSNGLHREDWKYTFTERIESVEKGVEKALEIVGERAKILVIPEGPYIIPRIEGGE